MYLKVVLKDPSAVYIFGPDAGYAIVNDNIPVVIRVWDRRPGCFIFPVARLVSLISSSTPNFSEGE